MDNPAKTAPAPREVREARRPAPPPRRRLAVGAEPVRGGVHFRVWAPRRRAVAVRLESPSGRPIAARSLSPEPEGYFSGLVPEARDGSLYRFLLDDVGAFPDPASRFQPRGPEGPSQVVDPRRFRWSARDWPGTRLRGQVLYEMHVGTFTRAGTWRAAARRLDDLARVGVTLVEVMPVGEFGGRFGWGYDGVDLFAPFHHYGVPDDFRAFVDRAHGLGLGVLLDVVYNHFGPVGNVMSEYALDYFSDRYETEWGYALNFDGPRSAPVREFFLANAACWIREYRLDGLRLDATQSMQDASPEPIVRAVARAARAAAQGRPILVIAENEPQDTTLLRPPDEGGAGLDGVWNDDFHHSAVVALTGRYEAYYEDYRGDPQEFISAAAWGYLYQGQYYPHQDRPRGRPTFGIPGPAFIDFLQNHDQIANSGRGTRLHLLSHPAQWRALTGFLLLIPATPLLFQGQEFAATTPFLYFADHPPALARGVRDGRAQFLAQFPGLRDPAAVAGLADPGDEAVFRACQLDERERSARGPAWRLHRDLLRLRRTDRVFREQRTDWMRGAVLGPRIFALRFFGGDRGDRLLVVNLGPDAILAPAPEPLLAPPADTCWELLWSSESPDYGGGGTPPQQPRERWRTPAHATLAFAPRKVVRLDHE